MPAAAANSSGAEPAQPRLRVAFFGGSFDPPHLGHLGIARAAQQTLALDTVLFAPVGRQPLKTDLATPASFTHRAAMTELAIAGEPHFALSLLDAPAADGQPNFTASTLERLRADLSASADLFLLIGADSLRQFARWHRAAEIPFLATLVVAARPEESRSTLDHPEDWLPSPLRPLAIVQTQAATGMRSLAIADPGDRRTHVHFLDEPDYPVSATELRAHLASRAPASFAGLLPASVLDYIRRHRLYEATFADSVSADQTR